MGATGILTLLLKRVEYRGNTAELSFDHVAGGLSSPTGDDSSLDFFEIAGDDGKYVAANAKIVGNQVHVTSPRVSNPKFVRYLFRKSAPDPAVSLVNSAGLPASSFMTDDFKPPRDPVTPRTPKRELTEAELSERRKARQAKRAAAQQASSVKPSPAEPMPAEDVVSIAESSGLAPEVTDLSSDDISFAKEKHLADLRQPFIDIAPEDMADGIEVGELGADSGNKEMILDLAREIAAGQHGEVDSLLIHHDGRLIFESYYRRGRSGSRAGEPGFQLDGSSAVGGSGCCSRTKIAWRCGALVTLVVRL